MSITPEDLLAKAKMLAASDTEMDWRLAVNRAYYGAYHMALAIKDQLPQTPQVTRKGGKHEQLLQSFEVAKGKIFAGKEQALQIHRKLKQGRDDRRIADYDLAASPTPQDAMNAIRNTEQIQALIAVFLRRQSA
ncbi:MAG: hypothetical protein ABTR07_17540 [Candidatus Competibacter denitrificans]